MASLGVALATEPLRLDIAAGAEIPQPIVIAERLESGAPTGGVLDITLGAGARATVIETLDASPGAGLAARLVRYRLGPGARLDRIVIQTGPDDAIWSHVTEIDLGPQAELGQTTLGFGGLLVRLETRLEHPGAGAFARLDGAYFLHRARHLDLTARARHAGPGGRTAELYKGAATGRATAVFQGRIEVARAAQQTDARLAHHALLLSDGASVNAKPELEIYADDVQCGHGATVGALDEDALFYMRARGLPEPAARAILTRSFLTEALAGAPEAIVDGLLAPALDAALSALDGGHR
jgi:Fe-S cluster assembly protein SufD